MEKPLYPKEWLDLRLEFKDEYLLKNKVSNSVKVSNENKTNDVIVDIPISESVFSYDKKEEDYGETLKKYDKSYRICCSSKSRKSKSCMIM